MQAKLIALLHDASFWKMVTGGILGGLLSFGSLLFTLGANSARMDARVTAVEQNKMDKTMGATLQANQLQILTRLDRQHDDLRQIQAILETRK